MTDGRPRCCCRRPTRRCTRPRSAGATLPVLHRRDERARRRRHTVEAGLRRALARQELVLHYQPKIALETGEISGVEALVRWRDPSRGLIGPTEFVSIAEESGLIVPLGRWALREACRQASAWCESGFPVAVAVNVSAIELRSKDFLEHATRVLRETGLDPRYLELELTESILMRQVPSAVEMLQALRALGVTIAIDDFGTGYSSVTYLRQFPVDVLKVDQSFIHEVTTSAGGSPIVSAMISMGRSLGHRVDGRGSRNPGAVRVPAGATVQRRAGLLFQPAVAGRPADGVLGGRARGRVSQGSRRRTAGVVAWSSKRARCSSIDSRSSFILTVRAPVAQLDRAPDFESVGRRFESCRARQPPAAVGFARQNWHARITRDASGQASERARQRRAVRFRTSHFPLRTPRVGP